MDESLDARADAVDSVSILIRSPPECCYEVVSDVIHMGQLSPECTGGRWIGSPKAAVPGARFVGYNRRGWVRWATLNTIVVADPGREFCFETGASGTRWRYRFEIDHDATLVTEIREPVRDRPLSARLFAGGLLGGVAAHDDEVRAGMRETLERLKAIVETP